MGGPGEVRTVNMMKRHSRLLVLCLALWLNFLGLLLTVLVLLPINADAQQLPNNEVDFTAAYCISVTQTRISRMNATIGGLGDNSPDLDRRTIAGILDKANSDLRRLQLYLKPRIPHLDAPRLLAVMKSGEEDMDQFLRDVDTCENRCSDNSCMQMCIGMSNAALRISVCNDLSFLPF